LKSALDTADPRRAPASECDRERTVGPCGHIPKVAYSTSATSSGPRREATAGDMGNALGIAQFGGTAPSAKPWKGLGSGVLEIVESHDGNAYRAVYTVRFQEAVYVLHAFQKKSPSGVRTAKRDVNLIADRLKVAQKDHEEQHGRPKR